TSHEDLSFSTKALRPSLRAVSTRRRCPSQSSGSTRVTTVLYSSINVGLSGVAVMGSSMKQTPGDEGNGCGAQILGAPPGRSQPPSPGAAGSAVLSTPGADRPAPPL